MLADKQGYHIEYSNTEKYPCWVVLQWQQVLNVSPSFEGAECFLKELKEGD